MSFQIFLLTDILQHFTNLTRHDLLTDNIVRITQNVLVRCLVIVSDHNVRLTGHFQNLVVQCQMTDYFLLLVMCWSILEGLAYWTTLSLFFT